MRALRKLLRVEQWYKNLLIFLPLLFFPAELVRSWPELLLGFAGLCASSSITYVINDWKDRDKDASHPLKKERPLASGAVGDFGAVMAITVLLLVVGLVVWQLGEVYFYIILAHQILTNLYSFGLKNVPVLDLVLIAMNFVLRMMAGLSELPDLYELSYFLLLFAMIVIFVLHKRRADIKIMGVEEAAKHKKVLRFYGAFTVWILRIFTYLLVTFSLYQLWEAGLSTLKVLMVLAFLGVTNLFLSMKPQVAIKPHYLFKEWAWVLVLLGMLVVFVL